MRNHALSRAWLAAAMLLGAAAGSCGGAQADSERLARPAADTRSAPAEPTHAAASGEPDAPASAVIATAPTSEARPDGPPPWPALPQPVALAAETARPRWDRRIEAYPGPQDLQLGSGVVVALTWHGRVVALDAQSGRTKWQQEPFAPGALSDDSWLAVSGSHAVMASSASSRIQSRELGTGALAWQQSLAGQPTSLQRCSGYRLVAATHRDQVAGTWTLIAHAIDPQTGATLWKQPASGPLVASGGGYLFVDEPSGTGRIGRRLSALRCQDGRPAALPELPLPFARLEHVDGRGVAAIHAFDFSRSQQQLCAARPGSRWQRCVDLGRHARAGYRLKSAAVRGRLLYFSMGHLVAHNLDSTPDSQVVVFDLVAGRALAKSELMVSNSPFADAGALLWTGIGGTGAADFAHLLDPADARVVRKLALGKAPNAFAADQRQAYVASADGHVRAIELPLAGPRPEPLRAVRPVPQAPAVAPPEAPFELDSELVIDAHPRRAMTSGQMTAGTVGALAFVGPTGRLLASGGNDDRLRVFDLDRQGKQIWASGPQGKDITGLSSCGAARFAARRYGGPLWIYRRLSPTADAFGRERTLRHGHAWMFGMTQSCGRLVADNLGSTVRLYDAQSGAELGTFQTYRSWDQRGMRVRGRLLVYPDAAGGLVVRDLEAAAGDRSAIVARPAVPMALGNAELVQAWAVDPRTVLVEHCGPGKCVVQLVDLRGQPKRKLDFDTHGAVWVPSVPSTLDLSADGAYLFFHRDGLEPAVVHVASDQRRLLPPVPRTTSSTPEAVFSPYDSRLLALAMHPTSHQISLMRIRERAARP